jgi:hypothetical protein
MLNQLRLLRDVSALALIAVTWRLWFSASDFPAVPLFGSLFGVPRSYDRGLSCVLVLAVAGDACMAFLRLTRPSMRARFLAIDRSCGAMFLISGAGLVSLNLHCLQPWMYHFLLLTPLLWYREFGAVDTGDALQDVEDVSRRQHAANERVKRILILWLTSSIYVWSAWSKLDVSFLESHGPKFVSAILDAIGLPSRFWSEQDWRIASAMLPIGELVVGIGLWFRKTRKIALLASLLMHFLLFVALGPWGLDHRPGVLLWNCFFVAQNVILFRAESRSDGRDGLPYSDVANVFLVFRTKGASRPIFAVIVTVASIVFPGLRSFGYCDAWPAWAVYASSPARVLMRSEIIGLVLGAEPLPKYFSGPRRSTYSFRPNWLEIDRWSLEATGAPIYPAARFDFAIATTLRDRHRTANTFRVVYRSEADRWTGERTWMEMAANRDSEIDKLGLRLGFDLLPRH